MTDVREEHLIDAMVENVRFLTEEAGLPFEQACKRVGKKPNSVEATFRRRSLPVPGKTPTEDP